MEEMETAVYDIFWETENLHQATEFLQKELIEAHGITGLFISILLYGMASLTIVTHVAVLDASLRLMKGAINLQRNRGKA